MAGIRIALALILAAALALAAPMTVAAHGSSHVTDSGAQHHAGHSHDTHHDDSRADDGDSGKSRPGQPYHDQSVADHSHQTAGVVRDLTIVRPSAQLHWRPGPDAEVHFDSSFRLERPPRS